MDVTQMSNGQLTQTIAQARDLIARQEREKQLLAALPLALAEQERRAMAAIRHTEDAHAAKAAAVAAVQHNADEWKAGLLALLEEAPQPPEIVDTVAAVFGNAIPREYREAEAAYKLRLSEYVNGLGAIFEPLRAIRDRRNLPSVKIGLTEKDAGRWWDFVNAVAGRYAAYF